MCWLLNNFCLLKKLAMKEHIGDDFWDITVSYSFPHPDCLFWISSLDLQITRPVCVGHHCLPNTTHPFIIVKNNSPAFSLWNSECHPSEHKMWSYFQPELKIASSLPFSRLSSMLMHTLKTHTRFFSWHLRACFIQQSERNVNTNKPCLLMSDR